MFSELFSKKPLVRALQTAIGEDPPDTAALACVAPSERSRRQRVHLWQLAAKLHCPLIGSCLTPRELARVARRHGLVHDARDDYALHVQAVGWAAERSEASRDLQRLLDGKYAADLARFDAVRGAEAVLALWKSQFGEGRVAGPMWAALTHPDSDEATRHAVYADVHMLSHQVGAGRAADARRLHALARENEALAAMLAAARAEAAGARTQAHDAAAELTRARADLAAAQRTIAALQQRLSEFESGQALVDLGRRVRELTAANEDLRRVAERVACLQAALGEARQRVVRLQRECAELAAARAALERLLANDAQPCAIDCTVAGAGPRARCVLCVGGRTAQLAHYRQLAQRLGLELLHHDGGREEALSRLPELIATADAVLCPTDCVSHGAYYLLKRFCKRSGKPCLLFKGAGISSFAIALTQVAAGRATVGAAAGREA